MRRSKLRMCTGIVVFITFMQLWLLLWLYEEHAVNTDKMYFYNMGPTTTISMDQENIQLSMTSNNNEMLKNVFKSHKEKKSKNSNPKLKITNDKEWPFNKRNETNVQKLMSKPVNKTGTKNKNTKLLEMMRLQMQRNMHNENKLKMKKKNSERTTIMGDNCFKYPGENSHHIQTPFKIYIYDIPKKFNDDIIKCHENPKINECTIKLSDCGYGPTMAHVGHYPNISIHETDQFSLEVVMHNKLLLSPYRTLDPQKADIFYIPAYIGLYCLTFNKCNNITTLNLVKQLFQYLKQMPFYASGKPHFSALGKINREQVLFPCDHLRHPYTHNMTFLSIEREYIVNEYLPKLPKQSIIVVPYPSYAHLRYGNSNSTITVNSLNKREVTVFLAASRHRNNKFRNMIMDQFPIRTSNTYYYYIQKRPSLQTEMVMLDTTGCLIHPQATIPWMRHSIFCLQPPGDSPTRKSFYDAIVSGCIPVIFSSQSHVVYPFENVLDYSDFIYAIPEAKILQGQYVKDILDSIPKTRIAELHKNVVKVTKWLQYSEFKSNIVEHNDAVQLILDELKLLHNL